MEISNNPSVLSPSSTATQANSQASSVLSSDFETFLQMLTAQAQYQDPLEPIDSSEYAAQLAQFSMVEQQVLSNDLLTLLTEQFGAGGIGEWSGWIGLEARTSAAVPFDGSPITILPTTDDGAQEAILRVFDRSGNEVASRQIEVGNEPFEWDGRDAAGNQLPSGTYRFSVESRAGGAVLDTYPAEAYARITEARREGVETVFVLDGGSIIKTDAVSALREPATDL